MCRRILCGVVLVICFDVYAQLPGGTDHFIATVNHLSGVHNDVFTFHANPASLAAGSGSGIGARGERKFLLHEVSDYLLSAVAHTALGTLGVEVQQSGFKKYNQSTARVAYGRNLADRLEAGAEIHFVMISMDGYGKVSVPGFGVGLRFHPAEKVHISVSTRDPLARSFGKSGEEKLPSRYRVGIGVEPSAELLLGFEMLKENALPVQALATLQYLPSRAVVLRAGMSLFNETVSLGTGWSRSMNQAELLVMVATSFHFQLGFSPSLQVSLQFPNKDQ